MSLKLLLVSLASASALVIPGTAPAHAARCASPTMEGIINESIDKDSPKVATMLKVREREGEREREGGRERGEEGRKGGREGERESEREKARERERERSEGW